MNIQNIHSLFLECSSISIDTRKIGPNSLFVALKGDNFDANTFAEEALQKGAAYVIIDNENYYVNEKTILVNDSLSTLQQLSQYHRNYLKLPIIALTGSNGKTTTKELINVVLAQRYNTKATVGNLNNHIGVPLTLLSFDQSTEIGIVEMGANHQKEIAFLCELATPDYGYITNFGKAHLEGFGGFEGVIKGKSEMYQYLFEHDKMVFLNLDDTIQAQKSNVLKHYSFSRTTKDADVFISHSDANPFVSVQFNEITIQSHLIGLYNANNINAAITIGKYFEVSDEQIKKALENYIPANNRSQLVQKGTNEIILDAYNANPSSMTVAIENFIQLDRPHKIMILGDMFELGPESPIEHQNIISLVASKNDNTQCLFIGKHFYNVKTVNKHFQFYETFDDLASYLKTYRIENHTILIKGSRGMALERTLELLP